MLYITQNYEGVTDPQEKKMARYLVSTATHSRNYPSFCFKISNAGVVKAAHNLYKRVCYLKNESEFYTDNAGISTLL